MGRIGEIMNTELSKNLRYMRLTLGLTQEEVGYICGFKKSHISHFETGEREPTLSSLKKLKVGLGCTYDDLLT